MRLYTIGYEGASLDDFVFTLQFVGVTHLIDIRERPLSRRKGFSKNALSKALADDGVSYTHLVGLGDPKDGRDAALAGEMDEFRKIFSRHMESATAQEDLAIAIDLISNETCCLLCYERNPKHCHRSIVASAISDRIEVDLQNLGVRQGLAKNGASSGQGSRPGIGQGAATRR